VIVTSSSKQHSPQDEKKRSTEPHQAPIPVHSPTLSNVSLDDILYSSPSPTHAHNAKLNSSREASVIAYKAAVHSKEAAPPRMSINGLLCQST
jgi:hypothetical protein